MARTAERSTPLDFAQWYVGMDFLVLPVHVAQDGRCSCRKGSGCQSAGKHPKTRHGCKDATTEAATIKRWFSTKKITNIGIATGKASGIVVIDIDPRNGGNDGFREMQDRLGKLPAGPLVRTGGDGWHFYLSYPEGMKLKQPKTKGVDLKTDGGYVVAPPSMHSSGNAYSWEVSPEKASLPELPESWLTELSGGVYQGTECLPGSEVSTKGYQGYQGLSRDTKGFQDIVGGFSRELISEKLEFSETEIEELIQKTLPTEPGHRHRSLFDFARGLKFLPEAKGKPISEFRPIVKQWHERALPVIINCRDFEEEWWDFCESFESATKPLGGGFMDLIMQRASEATMPKLAEQYENPLVRRLITICREAQRECGAGNVFFLSSTAIAEHFDDIDQRRAHRWLKGLCFDGVLELVESGKRARKANTYRYLGPLED